MLKKRLVVDLCPPPFPLGVRSCRPSCFGLLSTCCGPGVLPASSQAVLNQDYRLVVDVDLVTVLASVTTAEGALAAGLTRNDFQLFEDGIPQEIALFGRESDQALRLQLLFDSSLSITTELGSQREAAIDFLRLVVNRGDRVSILQVSENVVELVRETSRPDAMAMAFSPGTGTWEWKGPRCTPGVVRMTGSAARPGQLLPKPAPCCRKVMAGVRVGAKQVEAMRPARPWGGRSPPPRVTKGYLESGAVVYAACDDVAWGWTGPESLVRKTETVGRAVCKQPDGSAKTREVKLVLVWTAERRSPATRAPPSGMRARSAARIAIEECRQPGHRSGTCRCSLRRVRHGKRSVRGFSLAPRRVRARGGRCRLDLSV